MLAHYYFNHILKSLLGSPYSVNIRSLSDATCNVVFEIIPPVKFVTEEAQRAFGTNVLHLVCRRSDDSDDVMEHGSVEVTHNTPNNYSSIGYAKIASLRYGPGKEMFTQALLMALNGEVPNLYDSEKTPWEK